MSFPRRRSDFHPVSDYIGLEGTDPAPRPYSAAPGPPRCWRNLRGMGVLACAVCKNHHKSAPQWPTRAPEASQRPPKACQSAPRAPQNLPKLLLDSRFRRPLSSSSSSSLQSSSLSSLWSSSLSFVVVVVVRTYVVVCLEPTSANSGVCLLSVQFFSF